MSIVQEDGEHVNNFDGNGSDEDEDDFGDFADFQEATLEPSEASSTQSSIYSLPGSSTTLGTAASPTTVPGTIKGLANGLNLSLDTILNQTFTGSNQSHLEEEKVIVNDLFIDKTSQSYTIWKDLVNLEEAASLKLNWESSHTFQVFLQSLKIDPKNILNNHCVPKIGSSLGLVESIKSSIPAQPETTSQPPPSPVLAPVLAPASAPTISHPLPEVQVSQKPVITNRGENNPKQEKTVQSASTIPAANFDWNSSGLTNPLEETQPASNLFDFNFLMNNTNFRPSSPRVSAKMSGLEAESLQSQESPSQPLSIISSSTTDPFHNLISQIQRSSISSSMHKRQPPLTTETNQILEELPLLSFMRTKVLMFPRGDTLRD